MPPDGVCVESQSKEQGRSPWKEKEKVLENKIASVTNLAPDLRNGSVVLLLEAKIDFGHFQAVLSILDHRDRRTVTDLQSKSF